MAGPRTIKGAARRGWTVVYIPRRIDRAWLGTLNWISHNTKGSSINEYRYQGDGYVAFELEGDAVMAVMCLQGSVLSLGQ